MSDLCCCLIVTICSKLPKACRSGASSQAGHTWVTPRPSCPSRRSSLYECRSSHLIHHGVGKVGDRVAEPLDLLLYGVCSLTSPASELGSWQMKSGLRTSSTTY